MTLMEPLPYPECERHLPLPFPVCYTDVCCLARWQFLRAHLQDGSVQPPFLGLPFRVNSCIPIRHFSETLFFLARSPRCDPGMPSLSLAGPPCAPTRIRTGVLLLERQAG